MDSLGSEDAPTSHTAGSGWIILNSHAYIGDKRNPATAATGSTRNGHPIHASLWRERPPRVSKLYIDCPGARFTGKPSILCLVDNLVLFRVCIGPPFVDSVRCSDYFIYRADPERPSLELLPNPAEQDAFFIDCQAGILPCGNDHYIIAALIPVKDGANEKFRLHLFDSTSGCWSSKLVPVESPQRVFSVEIPCCMADLRQHGTTTVIILGGEGGTMGWVDLWRGILFCNLLRQNHALRGVPLPLPPMKDVDSGYESMVDARLSRGIAYVRGSLKLVEVETEMTLLNPEIDAETGWPAFRIDSWDITAWNNDKMSDSYDDWGKNCSLRASDIAITKTNQRCSEPDELLQQHELHSLFISDPALGVDDGDDGNVVYLTTRVKYLHTKSRVLALDMRNRTLRGVADAGPHPLGEPRVDIMNCPCSISKFTTTAKTLGKLTVLFQHIPSYFSDLDLLQDKVVIKNDWLKKKTKKYP